MTESSALEDGAILIIDDDPADRAYYKWLLKEYEAQFPVVHECKSVHEAQCYVESHTPKCCVIDFELPGETGVDFLNYISNRNKSGDTQLLPAVAVTSHNDSQIATAMLKAGANDYLVKEKIDGSSLYHAISNAIKTNTMAQELQRLAHYDTLTGLENRALFLSHLKSSIALADRNGQCCGLIFIDIDYFKSINDSYGHESGDLLLKECGKRLKECCRDTDHCARLGGDEFIILLHNADMAVAQFIAQKILQTISEPIQLHDQQLNVTPSMGIALYPTTAKDADELLRQADDALYKAKEKGRAQYQKFSNRSAHQWQKEIMHKRELLAAIEADALSVYYFPVFDAGQNDVAYIAIDWSWNVGNVSFPGEVLVRWAQELEIIPRLYHYLIKKSIQFIQSRGEEKINLLLPYGCDGNLSIVGDLVSSLPGNGFEPHRLCLEFRSKFLNRKAKIYQELFCNLKTHGVQISLNHDFNSAISISQLIELPIDLIKLDACNDCSPNVDSKKLFVKAMVALCASLGVKTVVALDENEQQPGYFYNDIGANFIQAQWPRHHDSREPVKNSRELATQSPNLVSNK